MAILKHVSSKNSNYGASIDYLTKQYDEKLNKPILDENNYLQEREAYLISYTRPDGTQAPIEDWEGDCARTNLKYAQNGKEGDIKTHHYIISFEDQDDIGLEDAQKYGEDIAAEMFQGHGYLVAAHPGHVHIVLNSVRDQEREKAEYMKDKDGNIKNCEWQAGKKHNCSNSFLRAIKQRVMEMCRERGLGQSVDLNSPAKTKKTDKEYYASKEAEKQGKLTQKDYIRQSIDKAKTVATTPEEYKGILKNLSVEMEARGNTMRYKTSYGEKWIREKSLGTDYMLSEIAKVLQANQYERENAAVRRDVKMEKLADAELIAQARLKMAQEMKGRRLDWALSHREDGTQRSIAEELITLATMIITGEVPDYIKTKELVEKEEQTFKLEQRLEECRKAIREYNRQPKQALGLDQQILSADRKREGGRSNGETVQRNRGLDRSR